MSGSDQSAAIAEFVCVAAKVHGALTAEGLTDTLQAAHPTATVEEFTRGFEIAIELLKSDNQVLRHMEMVNNPCPCGAPGIVVLLGADDQPTGERRCSACDLKEADAEKRPCVKCGKPLKGEDVRAGITLCEPCDPDEIGWYDDEATS